MTDAALQTERGDTHTIRIYNDRTGELEIEMPAAGGGVVVAHASSDGLMGTDQFAFGDTASIVLCALKATPVIKQMMKQSPVLAAALEQGAALAKEAGFATSLDG